MGDHLKEENGSSELLDEMDRGILNEIQSHFPIESRPYKVLADKLACSEEEVLRRVQSLKDRGIIRRIGANCNSRKLGYTSTLCAARVLPEQMERFVEVVNSYPGVTHNYLRNHEYNVWFTFIAPNVDYLDNALKEISEATGVKEILNMPAVKKFKIKVDFEV